LFLNNSFLKKVLDITQELCHIRIELRNKGKMMNLEEFKKQLEQDPTNQVSELKIMKSNAGFYIGRTCFDAEMQMTVPFDRQSEYFSTDTEARCQMLKMKGLL
tara:strand:+ start:2742 stop:3050 length:309 start_codon:yes stop_codon:yes gene_type:complete